MKTIQISQLKGENFDIHKLIESSVVIDKEDINVNRARFRESIKDLEALNEALFFKQEKLNLQQRSIRDKLEIDKVKGLFEDLQVLDIGVLGKSKEVLERNKEIYELKLINKVCRYFVEVEKGNLNTLNILIQSDDKDDWKFLGFFIQKTIDMVNDEIKIKLNKVKTDFEKKLFDVFEQGRKSRNRTIMKFSYIALAELDLEHTLIQTFIYDLEIFKTQPVLKNAKPGVIDVDFYDEEINEFFEFINNVRNTYQEELTGLENIFPDYEKAYKIINTKLYYDLIFPTLDNYLKSSNSFLFLYSLEKSYLNLVNLGNYIETISTKFDSKAMLDELKERYAVLALEKERALFTEVFSNLIDGIKTDVQYIIIGEEVKYNRNYNLIIKQLLDLVNQFLDRSELLYTKDDVYDMLSFYSNYLIKLINVTFDEKEDKVEAILLIEYIYLMAKRFFGSYFNKLHSFSTQTEKLIRNSFKWKIEQCEGRVRQITDQVYFYKIESDLYLLEYLKTQVDDVRRIKGKNFAIYCKHIFRYTFGRIKKRILEITFGDLQKTNIKIFKDKIGEYVDLLGISEIQGLYRYLDSLILIITIDREDLNELVNALKIKMDIDDIKLALKCRKDKKPLVL